MRSIFRAAILVSGALQIILHIEPYAAQHIYAPEVFNFLLSDGYLAAWMPTAAFANVLLLVNLCVLAALYFFVPGAPRAFVILVVALYALTFLWGYRVTSPHTMALGNLVAMIDGIILTMCYLTPLSHQFKSQNAT